MGAGSLILSLMRAGLLMIGICLASFSHGAHALVFIGRSAAGPNIDPRSYVHPTWIRWHSGIIERERHKDIADIFTGLPVSIAPEFFSQRVLLDWPEADWNPYIRLPIDSRLRLFFQARRDFLKQCGDLKLVVLEPRKSRGENFDLALSALTVENVRSGLGTSSPPMTVRGRGIMSLPVQVAAPSAALKAQDVVVLARARNWDDAREISNLVGGRTLVIEDPETTDTNSSRFWQFSGINDESNWPRGTVVTRSGIMGLLEPNQVLPLLVNPLNYEWKDDDPLVFGGANRWLDWWTQTAHQAQWIFALAFCAWIAMAIFAAARELDWLWLRYFGRTLMMVPAALFLAGGLSVRLGLGGYWAYVVLALVLVGGAGWCSYLILHRFWGLSAPPVISFVSLFVIGLSDPSWSPWSHSLRHTPLVWSPEQLGFCVFFAIHALAGTYRAEGHAYLFPRLLVTVVPLYWLFVWGIERHDAARVLPAVLIAATALVSLLDRRSENLRCVAVGVLVGCNPLSMLMHQKIARFFEWNGLIRTSEQLAAFQQGNGVWISQYASVFEAPFAIGGILVYSAGLVFSSGFLNYRLQSTWKESPARGATISMIVALFVLSWVYPLCASSLSIMLAGTIWSTLQRTLEVPEDF